MKRKLVKCTREMLEYMMRPIIECINFTVKTVFGSHLRSRSEKTRTVEACCRIIAYDSDRVLRIGFRRREFPL